MGDKLKQEIERLMNKYPWPDSRELFKAELERLVLLAKREQIAEMNNFVKELKKKD